MAIVNVAQSVPRAVRRAGTVSGLAPPIPFGKHCHWAVTGGSAFVAVAGDGYRWGSSSSQSPSPQTHDHFSGCPPDAGLVAPASGVIANELKNRFTSSELANSGGPDQVNW